MCPEVDCLLCTRVEEVQIQLAFFWILVLIAALVGFYCGRKYERRGFVVGQVVGASRGAAAQLPGKNRKKVGQL